MPFIISLFGQARIFYAMARDGLLPERLRKVHPTLRTPVLSTLIVGVVTSILAGFISLESIAELVNIGTLAAFTLVAVGIIFLRRAQPDLPRPFRTPLVPVVPLACIGFCLYLAWSLPNITHIRFVVWLAIGLVIYYLYGFRNSRLQKSMTEG